jgi:hypothetical protein
MFLGVVILSILFADLRCLAASHLLLCGLGNNVCLGLSLGCTIGTIAWHDQGSIVILGRGLNHRGHTGGSTDHAHLCGQSSNREQDIDIVGVKDLTKIPVHFVNLYNLRACEGMHTFISLLRGRALIKNMA